MHQRLERSPITHSRKNWDQIKAAFNFLADFVKTKQVNTADILIITPYSAMVEAVESFRKKREYEVLKEMRPPSTVDGIQGQEADMAVVTPLGEVSVQKAQMLKDVHKLLVDAWPWSSNLKVSANAVPLPLLGIWSSSIQNFNEAVRLVEVEAVRRTEVEAVHDFKVKFRN
ncbi:dna helicase [Fusarium langsethiae]|uniref:Dna helicase n=1 Tax=Fusarium langsethiae TaxID=179993 RepID=A0A0M9EXS2_FUSLA|nr:dna helicase [Fusarium langsethiae]GKU02652.1 unnamed protein product [Fusarium langsethiae]GKU19859.1 unnamed protein product [Fusarium langsethiae]